MPPTKEELDKLMEYIGRALVINVYVDVASWDYGDVIHNEYDVSYSMELKDVAPDKITGTILEDAADAIERKWHYRGRLMIQPFSLYGSGSTPWDAGTSKEITLIRHNDEILYD